MKELPTNTTSTSMIRRRTPSTHITAAYNPHLQALLLEHCNNRRQQAGEAQPLPGTAKLPLPAPCAEQGGSRQGAEEALPAGCQHDSSTQHCTCRPTAHPGRGQVLASAVSSQAMTPFRSVTTVACALRSAAVTGGER